MQKISLILSFIALSALALVHPTHTASFECTFMTKQYHTIYRKYTCQWDFSKVEHQQKCTYNVDEKIMSITGAHHENQTDHDVQAVNVHDGRAKRFPNEFGELFPQLELFSFQKMHLKALHKEDLQPFPKLSLLDLYHNELEIIEEDLFIYNELLSYLYIHHNKISYIDPTFLTTAFTSLDSIYINDNACTSSHDHTSDRYKFQIKKSIQENCTNLIAHISKKSDVDDCLNDDGAVDPNEHDESEDENNVVGEMREEFEEQLKIIDSRSSSQMWIVTVLLLSLIGVIAAVGYKMYYLPRISRTTEHVEFANTEFDYNI